MSKRNNLIDDILAKSEALVNTQSRSDGIAHIKRGIDELEESVRRSDAKTQDVIGGDAKAYRLLNQNANIDAENLTKEIISMDFKVQSEPLQTLEGTDIEGYLSHHHDMIFLSVIDEARKKTERDVRATQMRWEKEEWDFSRKEFMDSLGHRSQAWESGPNSSYVTAPGKSSGASDIFSAGDVTPLAILPAQSITNPDSFFSVSKNNAFTPNKKVGGTTATSNTVASVIQTCKQLENQQLPLLREHAAATRRLHMIDQSEVRDPEISINAIPTPCRDYLTSLPLSASASATYVQFDIRGENELKGYKFLLGLIASMTKEGQPPSGRNKPGYFSPVVAGNQHQNSTRELRERREALSSGAREHLENDYRVNVVKPESAAYVRNVTGNSGALVPISGLEKSPDFGKDDTTLIEEIQKYVSAVLPLPRHTPYNYSIECDADGVLFWPQIYYCMRVGALSQARELLNRDDAYHTYACAIEGLMQLAGNGNRFSPSDILSFIVKCKVEYNEAVNSEYGYNQGGSHLDTEEAMYDLQYQYKLQVLNLLGFVNLDALCNGEHLPDTTIQDFLWVNLWFRHWTHFLEEKIPPGKGIVLPCVVNEADIFYRVLEAGGADDFDPHGALAFEFAMILCCCHQFGGAVEHLYQHGKVFPAVHLLVLCLHYGLILPFLPLAMPMQGTRSSSTPLDLLQTWVYSSKVPLTITQKVDYLVALDSGWVNNNPKKTDTQSFKSDEIRTDALTRLLCEVDDAEVALLAVGNEGETPRGGYLRNYMSEDKMNHLLVHAATLLSSDGSHLPRVIQFYELAGCYIEVLEELNDQLSKVLIPPKGNSSSVSRPHVQEREFWLRFCHDFNEKHFSGGDSLGSVIKALNAMGRVELMHVFHLLLKLSQFIQLHGDKKFKEAKDFAMNLKLFPVSQEEKAVKVQEFSNFDVSIRRVMDDILLCYMNCIFELYQEKRRDTPHFSQYQKLFQDLRNDANLLLSFSGQIQKKLNRSDTVNRLMEYQNAMISDI